MRVLVTGAAGFIGVGVREILRQEHDLRLLDLVAVEGPWESIVGSVADLRTVYHAMEGMDAVVHLASAIPETGEFGTESRLPSDVPMDVNVKGTFNVLESARRLGLSRVVHLSSAAVITGYGPQTRIERDTPSRFEGLYPLTKELQEVMCRHYSRVYGLSVVWFRVWSAVDSRLRTDRNGRPLTPASFSFGLVCRYDVGKACARALEAPGMRFDLFHLMPTAEGRKRFDYERVEQVLGLTDACDFEFLRPVDQSGGAPPNHNTRRKPLPRA